MKKIQVVIGLNYGDEGKGLITDYYANEYAKEQTAVVRFNGGAQAGHTVQLANGKRHVFHTFGSGTLAGAPTILSRFFVFNPTVFWNEALELHNLNPFPGFQIPEVCIDPECMVTTPFDVYVNQELERSRGDERHGSCGVGVGETVERTELGFSLQIRDLITDQFEEKLRQIRYEYFPARMADLGLDLPSEDFIEEMCKRFIFDVQSLVSNALSGRTSISIIQDEMAMNRYDNLIFEGAQGLSLDQHSPDFPYVTRSNTGSTNVDFLLDLVTGPLSININYLTRTYLTRHGAGPLANEVEDTGFDKDETNIDNEFQGHLRFGPLDYNRIKSNVAHDMKKMADSRYVNKTAVITWCDDPLFISEFSVGKIVNDVGRAVITPSRLTVWGPTRECVMTSDEVPVSKWGLTHGVN